LLADQPRAVALSYPGVWDLSSGRGRSFRWHSSWVTCLAVAPTAWRPRPAATMAWSWSGVGRRNC